MDARKKELAFAIIEGAMLVFPPLTKALANAIERSMKNAPEEDRPLLEEVMARLPVDGESERVMRKLAEDEKA